MNLEKGDSDLTEQAYGQESGREARSWKNKQCHIAGKPTLLVTVFIYIYIYYINIYIIYAHYIYNIYIIWGFPGGLNGKVSAYDVGDPGLIPGLGRSPGEGNGSPLWYSCLENPKDVGTW